MVGAYEKILGMRGPFRIGLISRRATPREPFRISGFSILYSSFELLPKYSKLVEDRWKVLANST